MPDVGRRILDATSEVECWYQPFHQSPLVETLLDGRLESVRGYHQYFWEHWSGSAYQPEPAELDRLANLYGRPGAMVASINYYRAGAGTLTYSVAENAPPADQRTQVPTTIIWPDGDALFPVEWADRVAESFADVTVRHALGSGHSPHSSQRTYSPTPSATQCCLGSEFRFPMSLRNVTEASHSPRHRRHEHACLVGIAACLADAEQLFKFSTNSSNERNH